MSNSVRLGSVKIGINAATNTFDVEPAAYVPILPSGEVPSLYPRDREHIDRSELQTPDGSELPPLFGPKNLDDIVLPTEFRGVDANTGAAVADWEAKLEMGKALASMFGAVAPASVGVAPTVKSSGHTSTTLSENATTIMAALDIVSFPTSLGVRTRQVISVDGAGIATFDRSYTGTPTTGGTITRLARYSMVPGRTNHKGVWVDYEDTTGTSSERVKYKDCGPKIFKLTVPNSGKLMAEWTFKPNDWADTAEANPTSASPTAGAPIVAGDARFFDGSVEKLFRSLSFTMDTGFVERPTPVGPNGIQGGQCVNRKSLVLDLELYLGDNDGSIGDLIEDEAAVDLGDYTGEASTIGTAVTTRDMALQLGTVAGALLYLRIPAGAVIAKTVSGGGFKVVKLTVRATGSTPFYLGVG